MKYIIKSLSITTVIFCILTVAAAFLAYKLNLSEIIVWFISKAILAISCFLAGFISGKLAEYKRMKKGLMTGVVLLIIISVPAAAIGGVLVFNLSYVVKTSCLVLLPSVIGGMLAGY